MTGTAENYKAFDSQTALTESYNRQYTSIEIPGGMIAYNCKGKLAGSRPTYPGLTDLAIGVDHFLDCSIDYHSILIRPRDELHEVDLEFARDNGLMIRLVASAAFSGDYILGVVAPMFVDLSSPVSDGHRFAIKRGDDQESETDILPYSRYTVVRPAVQSTDIVLDKVKGSLTVEVFVGFECVGTVIFSDFDNVRSGYASSKYNYIIGKMALDKLWRLANRPELSIILIETIRRRFSPSAPEQEKKGYWYTSKR